MPGYNRSFELDIDDLELIEGALREKQRKLAMKEQAHEEAQKTNELLGRLHNQKNFYRPKAGIYVGG